ncbi:hypothetical protein A0J61_08023, partial [Choanephora cucurbitarum]
VIDEIALGGCGFSYQYAEGKVIDDGRTTIAEITITILYVREINGMIIKLSLCDEQETCLEDKRSSDKTDYAINQYFWLYAFAANRTSLLLMNYEIMLPKSYDCQIA